MSYLEDRLFRAIYDYHESSDDKILNFKSGDIFILLKLADDFIYVVNAYGRLGYIPSNFCESTTLNDNEYLQFVKNVLSLLESNLTKNPNITNRQLNHAQVKLTQLRCELVKKLAKLTPITPETKKSFVFEEEEEEANKSNEDLTDPNKLVEMNKEEKELMNENVLKSSNLESINLDTTKSNLQTVQATNQPIPDNLTLELLEKIRLSTNLNYNVCKLTLKSILDCLKHRLPSWHDDCNCILRQINSCDQAISSEFILTSNDYLELKSLFNKLWFCKNDEQQRSWPIQEDEEQIKYILNSLANILANANPKISKEVLCENNCENISLLITYFQMENRAVLKLELYSVLLQTIRLLPNVIPEIMLPSVLPGALTNELINYKMDNRRWSLASKLFTAIFSTAHKPPISIYDYINEQFICSLLDLVEEPTTNEISISPELSIPPILAFNLHFDQDDDYNYTINSLRNRNAGLRFLLEILVSYLNWSEDPTRLTSILSSELNDGNNNLYFELENLEQDQLNQSNKIVNSNTSDSLDKCLTNLGSSQTNNKTATNQPNRQNAVHKLLLEIFDDEIIANLFYYNDICVLIDILVTFLNNSHSDDQNRLTYLKIFRKVCENTNYKDEPHKLKEILKCLKLILTDERSNSEEKRLAEIIIELFV